MGAQPWLRQPEQFCAVEIFGAVDVFNYWQIRVGFIFPAVSFKPAIRGRVRGYLSFGPTVQTCFASLYESEFTNVCRTAVRIPKYDCHIHCGLERQLSTDFANERALFINNNDHVGPHTWSVTTNLRVERTIADKPEAGIASLQPLIKTI